MQLTHIVITLNKLLAGELLTYAQMTEYLDAVVDEINENLTAKYPVFSEFTQAAYPDSWPNYDFFPDRYIRTCVCKGAAFKYFTSDEEGIATAQNYGWEYKDAMFRMQRDMLDFVPEDYQDTDTIGSIASPESTVLLSWSDETGG